MYGVNCVCVEGNIIPGYSTIVTTNGADDIVDHDCFTAAVVAQAQVLAASPVSVCVAAPRVLGEAPQPALVDGSPVEKGYWTPEGVEGDAECR